MLKITYISGWKTVVHCPRGKAVHLLSNKCTIVWFSYPNNSNGKIIKISKYFTFTGSVIITHAGGCPLIWVDNKFFMICAFQSNIALSMTTTFIFHWKSNFLTCRSFKVLLNTMYSPSHITEEMYPLDDIFLLAPLRLWDPHRSLASWDHQNGYYEFYKSWAREGSKKPQNKNLVPNSDYFI